MFDAFRALRHGIALTILATPALAQSASFAHPDGTTHWYEAVHVPTGIDWASAHVAAARAGGYLATVTSADENAVIFGAVQDPKFWRASTSREDGPWLGGRQQPGASEPGGGWQWGELETFGFAAWAPAEPSNQAGADRLHYAGPSIAATWGDGTSTALRNGYVIEFADAFPRQTVGLKAREPGSLDGYTLISPWRRGENFLLDPRGRIVNQWTSRFALGMASFLLPDGKLLRCGNTGNPVFAGTGGVGGVVERFAWDGTREWSFTLSDPSQCLHHDVVSMPNGNVLMIVWEHRTEAEALARGRRQPQLTSRGMWPLKVVEVEPTLPVGGRIVWEWHAWDHVIQDEDSTKQRFGNVGAHPELIDMNYPTVGAHPDWLHANAIDYNPDTDQIALSIRSFDEVWIIDHSTTTAQAQGSTGGRSGKGGDLLYRWGNPEAYRAGTLADRQLFKMHDVQWIRSPLRGAGNLLVFNNGTGRPGGDYSSVDEIRTPIDASGNYQRTGPAFGPAAPAWRYTAANPTDFYASFVSGTPRGFRTATPWSVPAPPASGSKSTPAATRCGSIRRPTKSPIS